MSLQYIAGSEILSAAQGDRQFLFPVARGTSKDQRGLYRKGATDSFLGANSQGLYWSLSDIFRASDCALGFGFQSQ